MSRPVDSLSGEATACFRETPDGLDGISGGPIRSDSEAWGQHVGHFWAGQLRRYLDLTSTVAEVGPGFSTKVGFGLAELGFQGSVILVEPNGPARIWAEDRYRRLLPNADIEAIPFPVPEAGQLARKNVDLLLANHILDDLLLNTYVKSPYADRIFSEMHSGAECSEAFITTWHQLCATTEAVTKLVDDVVDGLVSYVKAVKPACLILNEYVSWQQNWCGLDVIHDVSLRTMQRLQERLALDRSPSNPRLSRNGPMFWLVCEDRKTQGFREAPVVPRRTARREATGCLGPGRAPPTALAASPGARCRRLQITTASSESRLC
jgi:hypothetical protein